MLKRNVAISTPISEAEIQEFKLFCRLLRDGYHIDDLRFLADKIVSVMDRAYNTPEGIAYFEDHPIQKQQWEYRQRKSSP